MEGKSDSNDAGPSNVPAPGSSSWVKRAASTSMAKAGSAFQKFGSTAKPPETNHHSKKKHDSKEAPRLFNFDLEAVKMGQYGNAHLFEQEELEEDFNEVVELDNERIEEVVSQDLVGRVVGNVWFRSFIIGATVVNAILIGAQTNAELSEKYAWMFFLFDHSVLSIFVWELCLKWYNGFVIYWKVGWNIVDFIVIVVLLLGPALTFLGSSTNFRIIRVLRAFRGLRSVRFSTGLTIVLETLLGSIPDIVNVAVLLSLVMLIFGVVGVFLFGRNFPVHFGNIQAAIYSLFICLTQDGWVRILEEMKNSNYYVLGAFYFILAIGIGVFFFTNLVVAVVISNTDKAIKMVRYNKKMNEDILSTKHIEEDNALDYLSVIPVVSVKEVVKKGKLSKQKPLFFGDFRYLTTEHYGDYLVLVSAMEDNLAKYKHIKDEINHIFNLVWEMNKLFAELDDPDPGGKLEIMSSENRKQTDTSYLQRRTDLLSYLLDMDGKNPVKTMQWNMSKFIKDAARNSPPLSDPPSRRASRSSTSLKSNRSDRSIRSVNKTESESRKEDRTSPEDVGAQEQASSSISLPSSGSSSQDHKKDTYNQDEASILSIHSVSSGDLALDDI